MSTITKSSKELQEELEQVQSQLKPKQDKYEELHNEKTAKLREFEKNLDLEYNPQLQPLSKEIDDLDQKEDDLESQIRFAKINEDWELAIQKEIVDEFFILSMLKYYGIDTFWITYKYTDEGKKNGIEFKQELKNGVGVWKVVDDGSSGFTLWLAFTFDGKLVGLSFRENSRHPGHDTCPYSFIGQLDNVLEVTKHVNDHIGEKEFNATFTEWKRELKKIKQEELQIIPFDDKFKETFPKGINNDWWY